MRIESIAISKKKGTRKHCIDQAILVVGHGLQGDAHAGDKDRQVSLLAAESIDRMRTKGLEVTFGDFAENIATSGIDWISVAVGTYVRLGETCVLKVTRIGKKCIKKCAIYYQAGDCIMPREGVFAKVIQGGVIRTGQKIEILGNDPQK
jgi:MOSC domain-containing protein YiiM